jgi:hypothetical protein
MDVDERGVLGKSSLRRCPQTAFHQSESRVEWLNHTFYGMTAAADPKNQAVPDLQNLKTSALCMPISPRKATPNECLAPLPRQRGLP